MRRHHDANQIFKLLVARAIAAKMLGDPAVVEAARAAVEAMAVHPHSGDAVACWRALLREPVDVLASRLGRDDAEGDYVRETMPAFMALDAATRTRLVVMSRAMHAAERETT